MKTLLNVSIALVFVLFFISEVSAQKNFVWNGKWTTSDGNNLLTLKIRTLTKIKFAFSFDIKNGDKKGKIDGVGYFDRGRGSFMRPEGREAQPELVRPCIIAFNPSGKNLIVNHNTYCGSYAGKDLVFAGEYSKDGKTATKTNIFERKSLPTAELENQLKNLTGSDYEFFQTAMSEEQIPAEESNLLAKRYNNCITMICEWDRALINHYDKELKFAAVFFKNRDGKYFIYYYSNLYKGFYGVPTDILNWTNDLKRKYGEITFDYRNETKK